jgi:hypothetical protein
VSVNAQLKKPDRFLPNYGKQISENFKFSSAFDGVAKYGKTKNMRNKMKQRLNAISFPP